MPVEQALGLACAEVEEGLKHIYHFADAQFQASQDQETCTRLVALLERVLRSVSREVCTQSILWHAQQAHGACAAWCPAQLACPAAGAALPSACIAILLVLWLLTDECFAACGNAALTSDSRCGGMETISEALQGAFLLKALILCVAWHQKYM